MPIISTQNAILVDGVGNHYGSKISVNKGSYIEYFTIDVAKPKSDWPSLKNIQGRTIRGAIWVLKNGVDISSTPNYYSTNIVNIDSFKAATYGDNYSKIAFQFNQHNIQATNVIIGFVSWEGNVNTGKPSKGIPTSSLLVYSQPGSVSYLTLDFIDATSTMPKGMVYNVSVKSYQDDSSINKPVLKLDNSEGIRCRTLSWQSDRGSYDSPSANLDDTQISITTKVGDKDAQWNTNVGTHRWKTNSGFDFSISEQKGLQDARYSADITSSNNFNNSESPYWVFDRTRILITFKPYENISKAASKIFYKVDESNNNPRSCDEVANVGTTLLICPRDEGIEDNELMVLRLWRCTYDTSGRQIGKSNEITIYFRTYANPTVSIAYPKNLPNESNYALWANELLNNKYSESAADAKQICATLNMLLTKDSGDTSGLPIYTRIYIAEFKGTYTADRKFSEPSNDACLSESITRTASWRGIQLDDGTIFQLSGMKDRGFTWDDGYNDDDHKIAIGKDASGNVEYAQDRRMYFRAGYKYVIKVRRFHAAAAGACWTDDLGKAEYLYKSTKYPGAKINGKQTNNYPKVLNISNWVNNINNIDINSIESEDRWVGPADGTSGLSWDSTRTYPGFSKADAVVIDCVACQQSSSNLIVTRPAVQEVGADHWITFGYRHLDKTPNGIDHNDFTDNGKKIGTININGTVTPQSITKDDKAGYTWSGHANTALRIQEMYRKIANDAHVAAKNKIDKLAEDALKEGQTLNSLNITLCEVYIDHQGFADMSRESEGNVRGDTLIMNTEGAFEGPAADTFNWNASGYKEVFFGYSGGSGSENTQQKTLNDGTVVSGTDGNHNIYGNIYTWIPIIGANNANGSPKSVKYANCKPKLTTNKLFATDTTAFEGLQCLDTSHGLNIVNTQETQSEKFNADVKSIPAGDAMPKYWREGFSSDGYLYTSHSGYKYTNYSDIEPDADELGLQFFSTGSQQLPGMLFKRVPPERDCENGSVYTTNGKTWIAIPTRVDDKEPLTRVSHVLYMTCNIFGSVKVKYSYAYTYTYKTTDESGKETTKTSEPITVTSGVNGVKHFDNTDVGLKDIGTGANADSGIILAGNTDGNGIYTNILTVYGEDNGGLGRCLSADDSTAIWYEVDEKTGELYASSASSPQDSNTADRDAGAIESPIKVRYTPLVQPVITNEVYGDNKITDTETTRECTRTSNEITLKVSGSSYTESNSSPSVQENMIGKQAFTVPLSYGMYRSAMGGRYLTSSFKGTFNNKAFDTADSKLYNRLNNPIAKTYTDNSAGHHASEPYNTDTFPSVGICNAMTVILIPHDRIDETDLTKQKANWFSERANYESISSKSNPSAKSVIVADVAKTSVYKLLKSTPSLVDHQLRTLLNCTFNYSDLFIRNKVITSSKSTNISSTRSNKLKENVWYDLVVVPVFTNEDGFGSDTWSDMNFQYTDGAGTINKDEKFGGGTSSTVYYYGSTPLVVSKFVKFHLKKDGGGTGGGGEENQKVAPVLFDTEPCILFPNVNTKRYNTYEGRIRENPGFWLDNSFRVVIRGPHFRDQNTIDKHLKSANYADTLESSLEEATNGKLTGADQCKDFRITDLMVHVGKRTETFIDESFQKQIEEHALDRDWLNARGLYTMRTNPEAFSKCTQPQADNNDFRSVITGGALNSSNLEEYCNRLVIFNPHIVNAKADSAEGYYIQIRYLNNEYGGTQTGMWSAWYGGIEDDEAYKLTYTDPDTQYNRGMKSTLSYCVPVRNYQDIFTGFRSYIKESTPGAGLVNTKENRQKETSQNRNKFYPGSGSLSSINTTLNPDDNHFYSYKYKGAGNHENTQTIGMNNSDISDNNYVSMFNQQTAKGFVHDFGPIPPMTNLMLEMNYVDYIIRNMAKLYFANYDECLHMVSDIPNVTFEDIGWTPAMAKLYEKQVSTYRWPSSNTVIDHTATDTKHVSRPTFSSGMPFAYNRYFRKPIGFLEFDKLREVTQHIVSMLRDKRISGVHIDDIDPKDTNGYGTGLSVLPIDSRALEWVKLNPDRSTNRMLIGHDSIIEQQTGNTMHEISLETNYIQQLMQIVSNKLTSPKEVDQSE